MGFVILFWTLVSFLECFGICVSQAWLCDSKLGLFVFPFGNSVFLFGIFVSQSRLTLGYHFRFGYACFCAGVAGYIFESRVFIFVPFGHNICMLKTCHWTFVTWHAQSILSIPEITPSLLYLYMFLVRRGHDAMMHLFVRSPAIYGIFSN